MIRTANSYDLEQLLNLLHQLSPPDKKNFKTDMEDLKQTLDEMILDRNYVLCVYQERQKLLGTATLLVQLNLHNNGMPYGHIENVVTDKNSRGKGIGQKMVDYLIKEAKERNCYKVILNCEEKNISFYKKCGFQATGEIEMGIDFRNG